MPAVGWRLVLVLLPPSETKHPGGDGAPLDLATLATPELTPVRERLVEALTCLAADPALACSVLGLSAKQTGEAARNGSLRTAPTLPALERYTGVLYDALDVRSLTRAQRARADRRLAVGSALFGLVRGADAIPAYRLSAGTVLPGLPTLRALWKPLLSPVLASAGELVVDLRSGSYQALAPVPGAVTVDVLSERPDGSRSVVSHFNKAHKGRVARLLATTTAEPADVVRLRALLRRAGLHVEHDGGSALTLVVPADEVTRRTR
ncbi:peroxide stress protein YaaA [Blastococcus sp. SYSU D00695]